MENSVSVCLINTLSNQYLDKVLSSLEDNQEFIKEVIYTGSLDELPETVLEITCLDINSDNKAILKNKAFEKTSGEWILFVDTSTELEDSTLEEFIETLDEYPEANIVYPNVVKITKEGDEIVNNYDNLYSQKYVILQGLTIEKYFPETALLVKRNILGEKPFNEDFKEYEVYEFLLRNLEKIKPALSELSFVNVYETETFIDTSYGSKLVRKYIVSKYPLEKLFPHLSWDENRELAQSTAYTMIGDALASYHDFYNATDYYRKALISFHNKHTLEKLIKAYVDMGLFENAKQLLSKEQGLSEEEIEKYKSDIEKIEKLISELEKGVEEGKLDEVLFALNDVIQIYQGAPVYNIAGVVQFYKGDIQSAYRFFYKAVIINPLEENILRNLTDVAKQIGKEEEVIALVKRILE